MKGYYIKSVLLIFLSLALFSCNKELRESPAGEFTKTIKYSVTVSQSPLTRVSVSGDEFSEGCYIFEEGDKLYVEHRAGEPEELKMYGVLNLISGAGTGTGFFEGELKCLNFEPTGETLLNATLVGAGAAEGFFSFGNPTTDPTVDPNSLVTGVTYPSSFSYDPLPNLVRKYSYFIGSSTFDARRYNNLTQQSVFLLFSLEVNRTKLNDPMVTTVSIKKNGNPVHTVTDIPVKGLTAVGNIVFPAVIPLSKNPDFQGAEIWADDLKCGDDFAEDLTLATNHYYNVKRSTLGTDWFRIKAIQNETTVTFNYTGNGIKYSLDGGVNWIDYNTKTSISLSAGQSICFQGSRENYKNAKAEGASTYGAPASTPIFEANKKCYIAGNIMTLLADREHLSVEAFDGAFSKDGKDNTWTDIDPSDPLLLPATTLTTRCYKGMFRRCTALQFAPDLPAETPAEECYSAMFRQCGNSNLKRVACFLRVKNGDGNDITNYPFMDDGSHQNLGENGYLDKWMQGTSPGAGDFYCHPDMNAYWSNYWTWISDPLWGKNGKNQFASLPSSGWTVHNWESYILPPATP